MRVYRGIAIPIPKVLNQVIAICAYALACYLLWAASHTESIWILLLCAVAFSYVGNTIFSLLHESVHRSFHPNKKINDFWGRISAAFFPTGFHFQRACHLGHHRRNRTDLEMFDLYYKDDNRLLKRAQLYTVLIGIYWTSPWVGCLLYTFCPWLLNLKILRNRRSRAVTAMSADAMISSIESGPQLLMKLEILFTIAFQLALFYFLDLSFWAWLACYWTFAINWGSLQYADHAWSVRDIRNGAWNLRVNKLVQFLFLNYHHHLAHHQHPHVPWIHLHKFIDPKEERPSFLKIYLKMWRGPTLTAEAPPKALDPEFEKLLFQG